MTLDQIILFSLFFVVFAMLLWGKWRYDLIAFGALLAGLVFGVVPKEEAFSGFGHPATVIVALVLVISRGLMASGAVGLVTRTIVDTSRGLSTHIITVSGIGAVLSAFMNNVAALALLMPIDLQTARKAGRSPRLTLMPLAFATILGGLVTLIGTPPNIIIAAYREKTFGESFAMFDFAPVGLICALVGVAFVALFGWRLIPKAETKKGDGDPLFDLDNYIAELTVTEKSSAIGKLVKDLDDVGEETETAIIGLVRRGKRLPGTSRTTEIQAGDMLVVEAGPEAIDALVGRLKLEFQGQQKHAKAAAEAGGMQIVEAVVTKESRIEGRSALSVKLLYRYGVTLLGVSREGHRFRDRVRKLPLKAGDVLLLLGPSDNVNDVIPRIGCLPLAERGVALTQHGRAGLAIAIFAAAVCAASVGLVYLPVALAIAAALYVLLDIVPIREVYDHVEWPVVVLLGSMLPLGAALESVGGSSLIGEGIASITHGFPPVVALTVLMIATMTLSDVLNNTATTVVAAPVALDLANRLDANADPFLMAVAVAASCAFLTPIGHKNNTLIMGPGGYSFGDYWRMGLPLEIIVVATAVPAILVFWPL